VKVRQIKWRIMSFVVLTMVTGCAVGTSQAEEATPTPIPTPIVPVKPTYRVQRGEVIDSIEFSGRIAPVVEEEHVTVVMVSHDGLVDEYVDEVLQLRDGRMSFCVRP